jgi:hypothetical protein
VVVIAVLKSSSVVVVVVAMVAAASNRAVRFHIVFKVLNDLAVIFWKLIILISYIIYIYIKKRK